MNSLHDIENIYFLGIGGIGMSALARYFKNQGKTVAGYDRTETNLTMQLISEGIDVHFEDAKERIPATFNIENTLVVYTPALPAGHAEYNWLKNSGFAILKRAKVLGMLCNEGKCLAVAGTHGKTTVSTLLAVILKESALGCGAFLGGISKNYGTNLLLPASEGQWLVAEADEYDRSFLNLTPDVALVTALDSDHLDIYGEFENIKKSFIKFISQIKDGGSLVLKKGVLEEIQGEEGLDIYRYSLNEEADFYAFDIQLHENSYLFSLATPWGMIPEIKYNYPGLINIENAVGAAAMALIAGVSPEEVKKGLSEYKGVKRRFDIRYKSGGKIFIDDYAHHPEELKAVVSSVRKMYPGKKITGIFQPHLYTRTRDFADGFAKSLSLLDVAVLLPVYPARELPIEGVSAEMIVEKMAGVETILLEKNDVLQWVENNEIEVLMTIGAGDIDKIADAIAEYYNGL
ncbi:UDP-N-acetylmuramate--L-alanine ligase [hydrothermal vent metagenome]|uniref:UDP-N-acetylmuramate--L-alanine ligase n=1 Tax=hydrothermal vent metagenome TaxID=652676 RepID=A0A3B0TED4_9ZZZZ